MGVVHTVLNPWVYLYLKPRHMPGMKLLPVLSPWSWFAMAGTRNPNIKKS